ncbi:MAG TPA: DUF4288 domain-containing protein [Chitinophagaceae bacterium]|nr:DUF4288 domain-containing protein [Chitinophagaceae bacterium]
MNWYLSKIIFRIICGDGNHAPQFDEQLRLLCASDNEQAFDKALSIGQQEAQHFSNQQGKLVEWKFIGVAELYRISELIDGAELFSRVQETDCADTYIQMVQRRAAFIRDSNTLRHLQLL